MVGRRRVHRNHGETTSACQRAAAKRAACLMLSAQREDAGDRQCLWLHARFAWFAGKIPDREVSNMPYVVRILVQEDRPVV